VKRIGPLPPVRACSYIAQAAYGLEYAFDCAAILHRDIKPGNILVDRNGIVKILDMGLARFFNDEVDMLTRKHDETLGTADYLAPEQAVDSHDVDIRADIYSLGATMYFLLTGSQPFPEGTVTQKLIWHQSKQPRPIRSLRPEVPAELVAVVDRMMSKSPDARYSRPIEVVQALDPFIPGPIDPPSEHELPPLSPAARAGMGLNTSSSGRHAVPGSVNFVLPGANKAPAKPAGKGTGTHPAAAVAVAPAIAPGYNPYANLKASVGSGPHSPLMNQIYATAAQRADAAVLPKASAPQPRRWLLPVILLAALAFSAAAVWQLAFSHPPTESATSTGSKSPH
jgi:serine/threonine protein kinase